MSRKQSNDAADGSDGTRIDGDVVEPSSDGLDSENTLDQEPEEPETQRCYSLFLYMFEERTYISRPLVDYVLELVHERITEPREHVHLDLWIESRGGDAHAAYKLMLGLRDAAATIDCLIIDFAKSAGTLIALGCDRLFMAASAELGPLDVQVTHPDRENRSQSGLDIFQSLPNLIDIAVSNVMKHGNQFVQTTGLTRSEILHEELTFMATMLQPVIAKLDPMILHEASNQLRIAEMYAERLLHSRAETEAMQPTEVNKIAKNLVEMFPSHGFVISRREAESLLCRRVFPVEEHFDYNIGRRFYRAYLNEGRNMVELFSSDILAEIAQEIEGESNNEDAG